jgi:hypothetical protein
MYDHLQSVRRLEFVPLWQGELDNEKTTDLSRSMRRKSNHCTHLGSFRPNKLPTDSGGEGKVLPYQDRDDRRSAYKSIAS